MSKRIVEVSEKLSHSTSETSDYGDFKKIQEIFSTKINRCNLYLISGIKRALYIFRLFQSSLVRIIATLLCFCLIFEQTGFAQVAGQIDVSGYFSQLGSYLAQDKFRPVHLRYLAYDSLNNSFKLLLDKGDQIKSSEGRVVRVEGQELKTQTQELLNYFFVGLSLPNESFWVNLRPEAEGTVPRFGTVPDPQGIIDPFLERTDIGRILLEADVQLKKDTARFTSPETPEGRKYWDRLYKKAEEVFGTTQVTIPTLVRPWIVPNEIIIRETADSAYIYKATLKVMLEEDYIQGRGMGNEGLGVYEFKDSRQRMLNEYSSQLIRELIIPQLTKEVNSAKRYAGLRQVYYSLILAQWFKQRQKGLSRFSGLPAGPPRGEAVGKAGTVPDTNHTIPNLIDSRNLINLTSKTSWSKATYFKEYQKSFKEGEYHIKEPVYTPSGQCMRRYFAGGITLNNEVSNAISQGIIPVQRRVSSAPQPGRHLYLTAVTASGQAGEVVVMLKEDSSIGVVSTEEPTKLPPSFQEIASLPIQPKDGGVESLAMASSAVAVKIEQEELKKKISDLKEASDNSSRENIAFAIRQGLRNNRRLKVTVDQLHSLIAVFKRPQKSDETRRALGFVIEQALISNPDELVSDFFALLENREVVLSDEERNRMFSEMLGAGVLIHRYVSDQDWTKILKHTPDEEVNVLIKENNQIYLDILLAQVREQIRNAMLLKQKAYRRHIQQEKNIVLTEIDIEIDKEEEEKFEVLGVFYRLPWELFCRVMEVGGYEAVHQYPLLAMRSLEKNKRTEQDRQRTPKPISYYEILGVSVRASYEAIKKAYRRRAMEYHPDKIRDPARRKEGEEMIKNINNAYSVLIIPEKRMRYSKLLYRSLRKWQRKQASESLYYGDDIKRIDLEEAFWQERICKVFTDLRGGEIALGLLAICRVFVNIVGRTPTVEELAIHSGEQFKIYDLDKVISKNMGIPGIFCDSKMVKGEKNIWLGEGLVLAEFERLKEVVDEYEMRNKRGAIGYRVWQLRKREGISLAELERRKGINATVISEIENGRVGNLKGMTVTKLAKHFNVAPSYILEGWNPPSLEDEFDVSYIGTNIRKFRVLKGFTVEQLSEKINMHNSELSKIENRNNIPSSIRLLKIAESLGVTINDLLKKLEISLAITASNRLNLVEPEEQWKILKLPTRQELGVRIRNLRYERDETQVGLAKAIGLENGGGTIGIIESGKRFHRTGLLVDLANHWRVTLFYLLTGRDATLPFRELSLKWLGENTKQMRQGTGKTQKELGAAMGLSREVIWNMENGGTPSLSSLVCYAKYFKVSIDDLLVDNSEKDLVGKDKDADDRITGMEASSKASSSAIASSPSVENKGGIDFRSLPKDEQNQVSLQQMRQSVDKVDRGLKQYPGDSVWHTTFKQARNKAIEVMTLDKVKYTGVTYHNGYHLNEMFEFLEALLDNGKLTFSDSYRSHWLVRLAILFHDLGYFQSDTEKYAEGHEEKSKAILNQIKSELGLLDAEVSAIQYMIDKTKLKLVFKREQGDFADEMGRENRIYDELMQSKVDNDVRGLSEDAQGFLGNFLGIKVDLSDINQRNLVLQNLSLVLDAMLGGRVLATADIFGQAETHLYLAALLQPEFVHDGSPAQAPTRFEQITNSAGFLAFSFNARLKYILGVDLEGNPVEGFSDHPLALQDKVPFILMEGRKRNIHLMERVKQGIGDLKAGREVVEREKELRGIIEEGYKRGIFDEQVKFEMENEIQRFVEEGSLKVQRDMANGLSSSPVSSQEEKKFITSEDIDIGFSLVNDIHHGNLGQRMAYARNEEILHSIVDKGIISNAEARISSADPSISNEVFGVLLDVRRASYLLRSLLYGEKDSLSGGGRSLLGVLQERSLEQGSWIDESKQVREERMRYGIVVLQRFDSKVKVLRAGITRTEMSSTSECEVSRKGPVYLKDIEAIFVPEHLEQIVREEWSDYSPKIKVVRGDIEIESVLSEEGSYKVYDFEKALQEYMQQYKSNPSESFWLYMIRLASPSDYCNQYSGNKAEVANIEQDTLAVSVSWDNVPEEKRQWVEEVWNEIKEEPILFHGTSSNNLDSIRKHGLDPAYKPFDVEEIDFYERMHRRALGSEVFLPQDHRSAVIDSTSDESVAELYAMQGAEVINMMLEQIPEVLSSSKLSLAERSELERIREKYQRYKDSHRPVVLKIKGSVLTRSGFDKLAYKALRYVNSKNDLRETIIRSMQQRVSLPKVLADDIIFPDSADTLHGSSPIEQKDSSIPKNNELGGIDLRALPIVTEPSFIRNLSTINNPSIKLNLDLGVEWSKIQRLVELGVIPSSERLKDYVTVAWQRGEIEKERDKIIGAIADILRLEEEYVELTRADLKDILVWLEA